MKKQVRILVLITARGRSKGLPQKNIIPLAGKPLIVYTIKAARNSRYRDCFDLVCSTDDSNIAEIALKAGCEVPFERPFYLSGDRSASIDVAVHALQSMERVKSKIYDYLVLLQPTSPMRKTSHIDEAISKMLKNAKADSVVSVVLPKHSPYKMKKVTPDGYLKSWGTDTQASSRRQDLPKVYALNGAIYITKRNVILDQKSFFGKKCLPYEMDEAASLDIDTKEDLQLANYFLKVAA